MEPNWLTQREFDSWRQGDTEFKQQMREHIEIQSALNLATERRMTLIEASAGEGGGSGMSKTRVSVISSIVSAAISGLVTALARGHQ